MDDVERVARTLCRSSGLDPDEVAEDRPALLGSGRRARAAERWRAFEAEARRFLAMQEAMASLDMRNGSETRSNE